MPKLAIIGEIQAAPGCRDQIVTLLLAHKARCLKDEPGSLQFEILTPREDETSVLLYEAYQDDDAFELHRNGPSIARWREETAGMVEKLHVTKCVLVD